MVSATLISEPLIFQTMLIRITPSSNAAISFWENLLDRCCGIPIQVSVGNTIPKRTFHPRIANLLATTADNGHWRQLPATVVSGNPSAADNAGLLAALA